MRVIAMTPTTINIGWQTAEKEYRLKQGAQGTIQVRLRVRQDDGQPLPSYQGFDAKFALATPLGKLVKEFTVANGTVVVYGDDTTKEVIVEVLFKSEHTATFPSGIALVGDLKVTLPNGVESQYPYQVKIHVIKSYAL